MITKRMKQMAGINESVIESSDVQLSSSDFKNVWKWHKEFEQLLKKLDSQVEDNEIAEAHGRDGNYDIIEDIVNDLNFMIEEELPKILSTGKR